jgi:hypothetical protein
MRTLIASSIALSLSGVPSQSAGGPACGSTSALDSREGSRSYLMRSRSGFWRVPQHYPGDGLGPSPGTGAGDIYPPGVFSCLGQQTTRIKASAHSAACRAAHSGRRAALARTTEAERQRTWPRSR